jgi:peptidoglycan/xylan/chitin deacetylase (PgdA/CDA1 family)
MGVEFALHGYDHVDFRSLSETQVRRQFLAASEAFNRAGIGFRGFRCPYLSYTGSSSGAVPNGGLCYSSNLAIWWSVVPPAALEGATAIFHRLRRFYQAESAEGTVAVPSMNSNCLEIPASLPDDLQLYDGLGLGEAGIAQGWTRILHETHRRGEIFVLLFHPESFRHSASGLENVLRESRRLAPRVWVTRLRDVGDWWHEKSGFAAEVVLESASLRLRFLCSERATVLVRDLPAGESTRAWHGRYRVLPGRSLCVNSHPRPFVGVAPDLPARTIAFLREQGYIVEAGQEARHCAVYLDASALAGVENQVDLIEYIESAPGPLVRFWRWPGEARSALCVTGDLDALSLVDYASRLIRMSGPPTHALPIGNSGEGK